jgi:hypothetical protein
MLHHIFILVHRRVDVLHDPRLQEVESMIGHRCAPQRADTPPGIKRRCQCGFGAAISF